MTALSKPYETMLATLKETICADCSMQKERDGYKEWADKLAGALEGWNGWAELMVDEGVLDDCLVGEYHAAESALASYRKAFPKEEL